MSDKEYSVAWNEISPPEKDDGFDVSKFERGSNIPSDDKLEEMSHSDMVDLRNIDDNRSKASQNKLAPYEHRAWAREYAKENPVKAIAMPIIVPGYEAAKAVGLMKGRSDPSFESIKQGIIGTGEGIIESVRGKK